MKKNKNLEQTSSQKQKEQSNGDKEEIDTYDITMARMQKQHTDLPGQAVAFAVVVAQVAHVAADDIHTRLSPVVLRAPLARLVRAIKYLRHGADVRASVALVGVEGVEVGVPAVHLGGPSNATLDSRYEHFANAFANFVQEREYSIECSTQA